MLSELITSREKLLSYLTKIHGKQKNFSKFIFYVDAVAKESPCIYRLNYPVFKSIESSHFVYNSILIMSGENSFVSCIYINKDCPLNNSNAYVDNLVPIIGDISMEFINLDIFNEMPIEMIRYIQPDFRYKLPGELVQKQTQLKITYAHAENTTGIIWATEKTGNISRRNIAWLLTPVDPYKFVDLYLTENEFNTLVNKVSEKIFPIIKSGNVGKILNTITGCSYYFKDYKWSKDTLYRLNQVKTTVNKIIIN